MHSVDKDPDSHELNSHSTHIGCNGHPASSTDERRLREDLLEIDIFKNSKLASWAARPEFQPNDFYALLAIFCRKFPHRAKDWIIENRAALLRIPKLNEGIAELVLNSPTPNPLLEEFAKPLHQMTIPKPLSVPVEVMHLLMQDVPESTLQQLENLLPPSLYEMLPRNVVAIIERCTLNLNFIQARLEAFREIVRQLGATHVFQEDLAALVEAVLGGLKSFNPIKEEMTEVEIQQRADSIFRQMGVFFKKFLPNYQERGLSPRELGYYFRRLATVLFADAAQRQQFCNMLRYREIKTFDAQLLVAIDHKMEAHCLLGESFEDLPLVAVTPNSMSVIPFQEGTALSSTVLLMLVHYWYAEYQPNWLSVPEEPAVLLQLKAIALDTSSELPKRLEEFIQTIDPATLDNTLLLIFSRLMVVEAFNAPYVGAPMSIRFVELALNCYDMRSDRFLFNAGFSEAQLEYCKIIARRYAPATKWSLKIFTTEPPAITSLRKWCQKTRDLRDIPQYEFYLNRVELESLYQLFNDHVFDWSLPEPNAIDAVYLVVVYAVARSLNQHPRYILGQHVAPGQYEDKVLHTVNKATPRGTLSNPTV